MVVLVVGSLAGELGVLVRWFLVVGLGTIRIVVVVADFAVGVEPVLVEVLVLVVHIVVVLVAHLEVGVVQVLEEVLVLELVVAILVELVLEVGLVLEVELELVQLVVVVVVVEFVVVGNHSNLVQLGEIQCIVVHYPKNLPIVVLLIAEFELGGRFVVEVGC